MKDQLIESIRRIPYLAVLMDGSTDSSVTENEAIYVLVVGADGTPECHFFAIKSVPDATAFGIKALLEKEFPDIGVDLAGKVISICVEGAAVNLGVRRGLATLLKEKSPWFVAIHCMNHWLQLTAKDAFSNDVSQMLMSVFHAYEKSPKRLREFREMAEVMEEQVRKPDKASGTRWVQLKFHVMQTFLLGYKVIAAHLHAMPSE